MTKALITSLAILINGTFAWWDKAHLIVARLAYDELIENDMDAYNQALAMLDVLKNSPSVDIPALDDEDKYPFVECAPFADSIKAQGYSFQSNWHFVDTPYLDESQNIDKYDFSDWNTQNASQAINDIYHWLSGDSSYRKSETYTTIAKYFPTEDERESFALRLLIHYVGDIHQPCHGMTRVDSAYPQGDRGCNSVHLHSRSGASNLHAVWDSDIYQFAGTQPLPLYESTFKNYGTWAAEIHSKYPIDTAKLPLSNNLPFTWAAEDITFGPEVYEGVKSGATLSNEYIQAAQEVTGTRINYAGVRLGNMVSSIFAARSATSIFLE